MTPDNDVPSSPQPPESGSDTLSAGQCPPLGGETGREKGKGKGDIHERH
jgi:hypothetical protein